MRETICVSEDFCYQKILWKIEGGGNHDFPSKLFCIVAPKQFVEEQLFDVFQKTSGSEIFMVRRRETGGGVTISSIGYFLFQSTESFRRGTLLCFRKFRVSKIFMDRRMGRGGSSITIFRRKLFVSQYQKILQVTIECFRYFLLSQNPLDKRDRGRERKKEKTGGITIFSVEHFSVS